MKPDNVQYQGVGISPVIAIIIMVAVTVILGGVLFVWVTSLSMSDSLSEAYEKELGVQEVPVEPIGMEITSILDVEYVMIENDLMCIYTVHYTAIFIYDRTSDPTTTTIPLPKGSIEDIAVELNGQSVVKPVIVKNSIQLSLPTYTENEVVISYTAYGMNDYNHAIPKNKLIDFVMRLELKGVEYDYEQDLPKKCLTPDTVKNSGDNVLMEWDKSNAILKKDIMIELPERTNPLDDYGVFLFYLAILIIFFALFYLEGFKRIGTEVKNEYLAFLITPLILLYIIIGLALVYFSPIFAVPLGLLCYFAAAFLVEKKMLPIKKGFNEMLLFPYFIVVFVAISLFFWNSNGLIVGTFFLILAIIVILNFFRKYKVPPKAIIEKDLSRDLQKLQTDHRATLHKLENLNQENEVLRAIKRQDLFDKRFCAFCGGKIGPDFDYCSKCGKNIKKIMKCPHCNILVSGKEKFCPNCGVGFAQTDFPYPNAPVPQV